MNVLRLKTDKDNLVFVGVYCEEEYYLDLNQIGLRGWSFMGLRPATEDQLRERQRDTDPRELGFDIPNYMEKYFDYDAFADDMEEQWEEHHDVQAKRVDEDGETLYLGFGSGQDYVGFFKENSIVDYESYCEFFEEIGLTEEEFKILIEGDEEKIVETLSKINEVVEVEYCDGCGEEIGNCDCDDKKILESISKIKYCDVCGLEFADCHCNDD